MRIFIFSILLFICFQSPAFIIWQDPPVQLPENVREWLYFEISMNPMASYSTRTTSPIALEHVEIPIHLLGELSGLGLRPEIYSSLVVTRDGKKFVRWIFNPEDTRYKQEVLNELRKRTRQEPVVQRHFIGYLTASRSIVVQAPDTSVIFSLKTSTNNTGGIWTDKKMTTFAARISRAMSDFMFRHSKSDKLKSYVPLTEPLAFTFGGVDQAFSVRDYPIFTNAKLRLIPFFTALHSDFGASHARAKGEYPADYWKRLLAKPWGLAMAEALAYYGLYPNSAHGQDYLLEADERLNPTGRVYGRDQMDSDADRMILQARGAHEVLAIYNEARELKLWDGKIYMKAIPFNSVRPPDWMLEPNKFMEVFYDNFTNKYGQITKVKNFERPLIGGSVIIEKEVVSDPAFLSWLAKLKAQSSGKFSCHGFHQAG